MIQRHFQLRKSRIFECNVVSVNVKLIQGIKGGRRDVTLRISSLSVSKQYMARQW
jgi:hypothetical protein